MKRDHENYNHSISEFNSILVLVMDTATQNQILWLDLSEREVYGYPCGASQQNGLYQYQGTGTAMVLTCDYI